MSGLVEIARLVKRIERGAAPREEAHVAILDAGEQQIVRSAPCAFDIGQYKVQASAHDRLLASS